MKSWIGKLLGKAAGVATPWFGKAATWIGLNVVLPWARKQYKALVARWKLKQTAKEAAKKNEEYENNPTDDSFGSST